MLKEYQPLSPLSRTLNRVGKPTPPTAPLPRGDFGDSTCDNCLGRLVKIDDPAQTKSFSYDKIGRVKTETRVVKDSDTEPFTTSFKYDLLGRKIEITYPTDQVTNRTLVAKYIYAPAGIKRINIDDGKNDPYDLISDVSYNEFGQQVQIIRNNGVDTFYQYDIKGRLTNLQTIRVETHGRASLQNVNYGFRIDNTIATKEDILDDRVTRYYYKYDGLGRLVDAEGNYSIAGDDPTHGGETKTFHRGFDYSSNGNILNKKIFDEVGTISQNWIYSYDNHAVTQIDVQKPTGGNYQINMSYDATGNMVFQENTDKDLVKNILFDSSNRIKQVHDADNNLIGEYSYDDYGFRVRKLAKSSPEVVAKDRKAKFTEIIYPSMYYGLERQLNRNKAIIDNTHASVNNIYLNGVRIASVSDTGKTRYYLTDQVDSVKVIVDGEGATLNKFEYYPYGETWITEGEGKNNPKYNSQELDRESNFYFYNARHYDPEICRFVTADSVVDGNYSASGWNRYMYVGGNPIGYKDPTGHDYDIGGMSMGDNDEPDVVQKEFVNKKAIPVVDKTLSVGLDILSGNPGSHMNSLDMEGIDKNGNPILVDKSSWSDELSPFDFFTFGKALFGASKAGFKGVKSLLKNGVKKSIKKGIKKGKKVITSDSSYNIASYKKLKKQLQLESAYSPFGKGNNLKKEVIKDSKRIMEINTPKFRNKKLKNILSKKGKLSDWGKYQTPTFNSPSGDFTVHFYKNKKTNEVFYDFDYKAVFNHQGIRIKNTWKTKKK